MICVNRLNHLQYFWQELAKFRQSFEKKNFERCRTEYSVTSALNVNFVNFSYAVLLLPKDASGLCRPRRELSNEVLIAKSGVDTAENEPSKVI